MVYICWLFNTFVRVFNSFDVFGFILCMSDSKRDINCSQNLRCLFLIYLLAVDLVCLYSVSLAAVFVWRYFLYAKFSCSTISFISSSQNFNLFFLYFPRLHLLVLMFFRSKLIYLLCGISCSFCRILCIAVVYFHKSVIERHNEVSLLAVFLGKCNHFCENLNLAKVKKWSEPILFRL